jgi:hypothetical protein
MAGLLSSIVGIIFNPPHGGGPTVTTTTQNVPTTVVETLVPLSFKYVQQIANLGQ